MNRYFPSSRIISLLIACGLILLSVIYVNKEKFGTIRTKDVYVKENSGSLVAVEGTLKRESAEDSDGDALYNWEESLWKTDPNNPDTDADGTKDGEEISKKRNPTKKGPNDLLALNAETSSIPSKPLTATEQLGRDIFTAYIETKYSANPVQTSDQLITELVKQQRNAETGKKYTRNNITVISQNDETALRVYANAMGSALSSPNLVREEHELDIVRVALETNKETDLKKLDPIIAAYKKVIVEMLKVPVPSELLSIHLDILNNYQAISDDVTAFKKVLSDPLVGLVAMGTYVEEAEAIELGLKDFKSYYDGENISFEQEEYGYAFTHSI